MFPFHLGYYNFTVHTRRPFVRSFAPSFVIVIGIQWIRNMKPDDEGRRAMQPSKRRERERGREGGREDAEMRRRGLKYSSSDYLVR